LAPERDVKTLAAHLLTYLKDDAFWERSRVEGPRWVRSNFNVQTQTSRLERLYDEVVSMYKREKSS
jgi:hypothetical protein